MKALRILSIAASLSLGFALPLHAQDVLITQEGDAHKVYEIEIGGSSIFYKLENTPEAAIQKINKSQVLMIKYQDGRKVIMGEEEKEKEKVAQNEQQEQSMSLTLNETLEIAALNAKFVEEYNQRKVEFTEEPKDKRASKLFCTFGLKNDARLQDKNVKIALQAGENFTHYARETPIFKQEGRYVNPGIQVIVENISTRTLYVDLGNSFFVRNGEASPYYTPSATSTTTGTSGGASINLGSVASALGVGGIAGTLASGVNVGGGKSSSSSTVTYAQRIVAIPPKSEIKLEFQRYFLPKCKYWKFESLEYHKAAEKIKASPSIKINRGETICYTEKDKTLTYGIRIAYAFDEACQQTNSLYADIFLKEILGGMICGECSSYSIDTNRLTPNWKDVLYMVADN